MNFMFPDFKAIDLTHTLHEKIPSWNGSCGFRHEIKMDYDKGVRVMKYETHAGVGTHIDAPCHFVPGGRDVAEIPLEELIVPVYVIHMTGMDADSKITAEDIRQFEKKFGKLVKKSLFLGHTGWSKHWNDPQKYRNPSQTNEMHFPGFSADAAGLLLEREVVGLGIDTLSPDGSDMTFPVHKKVLGAGKYILENLAHLEKMPPKGAHAIILPLKVHEGAEAGVRAVGLVPR